MVKPIILALENKSLLILVLKGSNNYQANKKGLGANFKRLTDKSILTNLATAVDFSIN